MIIREPAVAGTFYPSSGDRCRDLLDHCFDALNIEATPAVQGRIVGGVVPHAGWECSGKVAAGVFAAIAAQRQPQTVVILGAVHRVGRKESAVFPSGRWETPLGTIDIDVRLAERMMSHTNLLVDDPYAHEPEHSVEVQVPFIQRLFPNAKLLPIMVPPVPLAEEVGQAVGRTLASYDYDAVVIASSDLTHYGQSYGFTPKGSGDAGLTWAKDVNDRRVIDRMLALDAAGIVPEAVKNRNACGSGAIAAAIAAVKLLGANRGVCLQHTTSRETLGPGHGNNAVGYAGVVFTAESSESSDSSPKETS